MATRNTTRTSRVAKTEVAEQVPVIEKPAGKLPDGFVERAMKRSEENIKALASSGVFSSSEFEKLKSDITEAYLKLTGTSGPQLFMTLEALIGFLKDGRYRTFGDLGVTKGDADSARRVDYTKRTYGYEDLKDCEKYGIVPVEEVNPDSPVRQVPMERRFCARYGTFCVKLKKEVASRTSINLLDSAHQWGVDGAWKSHGYGWLFPVPYKPEGPSLFVGCLMSPPTPPELAEMARGGEMADYFKDCIKLRNQSLLFLMQGRDDHDYVEAHVHGEVTPEDIDTVVYVPRLAEGVSGWIEARKKLESLGVKVVPSAMFKIPAA